MNILKKTKHKMISISSSRITLINEYARNEVRKSFVSAICYIITKLVKLGINANSQVAKLRENRNHNFRLLQEDEKMNKPNQSLIDLAGEALKMYVLDIIFRPTIKNHYLEMKENIQIKNIAIKVNIIYYILFK